MGARFETIAIIYVAIGVALPIARALSDPGLALDEARKSPASYLLGDAGTALLISVSVLMSCALSAVFWPVSLYWRINRRNVR